MNQLRILLLVTLALLVAGAVSARVPRVMSYQGVVLDGSGNPVPGPVTLVFNIYEEGESGGALVWTETHNNVPLTGGVFDVELGTMSILNFPFDRAYEIEVESPPGNVLSPKKRLTAAPYSLGARNIDDGVAVRSLNGLTDDLDLVAGTNVSISAQGDSALVISSSGGGIGGADSDWQVSGNDMTSIPSGRVGIGIAPGAKLHVYDQDTFGTTLRLQDGGSGAFGFANFMMMTPSSQARIELFNNLMNIATYTDGVAMQLVSHEPLEMMVDGNDRLRLQLDGTAEFLADDGLATVQIQPDYNNGHGRLYIRNTTGSSVLEAESNADGSGEMEIRDGGTPALRFEASQGAGTTGGGLITVMNEAGLTRAILEANENGVTSDGAQFEMYNDSGVATFVVDADLGGTDGAQVVLYNSAGVNTIEMRGQESTDPANGAAIYLRDDLGNTTIEFDADYGASGEGRIITEVLEITGGADLSEQFDIAGSDLEPGTVVVIDPSRPGGLARSTHAYDKRVAGVISGAGGVKPGMVMGQKGSVADGAHPVALTGRVYVKVDAAHGAIEPGDLLTTSPTPGHAMKATDFDRAHGTILGKAMTGLESGTGLVLVLVTLQ